MCMCVFSVSICPLTSILSKRTNTCIKKTLLQSRMCSFAASHRHTLLHLIHAHTVSSLCALVAIRLLSLKLFRLIISHDELLVSMGERGEIRRDRIGLCYSQLAFIIVNRNMDVQRIYTHTNTFTGFC